MTETQKEQILQTVRELIVHTEFENHVFVVGGAVRDELMGLEVKDLDMCVDLPDGGIRLALFITRQQKTYRKGAHPQPFPAYGIARFHLAGFSEIEIECAQTRKERYEHRDSRNPVTTHASLREDCMRRDLTINSLYKNVTTGEIVDITGEGLNDLRQHQIRTTRDAVRVFDEDPLRMLRCIRYAARLNWTITPLTQQGLVECAPRIQIITQDRVTDELSRMLAGGHPHYAMSALRDTGLLAYVLPEWYEAFRERSREWEELMEVLRDTEPVLESRLAAFLLPFDGEKASAILRRLNFPVEWQKKVKRLCQHLADYISLPDAPLTDADLRRLQYAWGEDASTVLHLLAAVGKHKAVRLSHDVEETAERCRRMQEEGTDCFAFTLPLSGKDIMDALHLPPGPQIRQLLDRALALCFVNPKRTKAELLQLLSQPE